MDSEYLSNFHPKFIQIFQKFLLNECKYLREICARFRSGESNENGFDYGYRSYGRFFNNVSQINENI